jgi:hypothetical protein
VSNIGGIKMENSNVFTVVDTWSDNVESGISAQVFRSKEKAYKTAADTCLERMDQDSKEYKEAILLNKQENYIEVLNLWQRTNGSEPDNWVDVIESELKQ